MRGCYKDQRTRMREAVFGTWCYFFSSVGPLVGGLFVLVISFFPDCCWWLCCFGAARGKMCVCVTLSFLCLLSFACFPSSSSFFLCFFDVCVCVCVCVSARALSFTSCVLCTHFARTGCGERKRCISFLLPLPLSPLYTYPPITLLPHGRPLVPHLRV